MKMETVAKKCRPKGRPTKRTPRLESGLLKSIEDGLPLSHAAAVAGISYETFCEWRRQFSDFSDAIAKAVARGVAHRLRIIRNAAESGDVKAAQWWLEHVLPEHFARNRIELSHQGSVQHQFAVPPALLEDIARARAEYDQTARN
jgi:hypothetical protein